MTLLYSKLTQNTIKVICTRHNEKPVLAFASRKLSIVPSLYDGKDDPGPKFFSSYVQAILKRLTRPNFAKVFRKRTSSGFPVLKTPTYKFLTNEELEAEINKANEKADKLLQMPPILKIHQPIEETLSVDPALIGYDTSKYLFTDITFGVPNEHRIIVERNIDGTLRSCDHDVRKRLNETYFPMAGRKLREPVMFTDDDKFNSLLDREEYEFVLDRACIQYEPDEVTYQKITSITYQHIDMKENYDKLRSTRHFGPMAFYLTWHESMDGLVLQVIQQGAPREAALLAALRDTLRADTSDGKNKALAEQILSTPLQLQKLDSLTEEDIQLDNKCIECVKQYIVKNSSMKSQHELALQGFRESYQQMIELSRGLKKAHGNA